MLRSAIISLALMGPAAAYSDPPARFDHPNKNVVVKWVDRSQINIYCNDRTTFGVVGCARPSYKPCIIFAVHGDPWSDARLLRHETAHCNGWPGNHPP